MSDKDASLQNDSPESAEDHVQIRFCASQEEVWATTIFNGNAFPKFLEKQAETCGIRLALARRYAKDLNAHVSNARNQFLNTLERNRGGITGFREGLRYVAYHYDHDLLSSVSKVLHMIKAYLDVFAHLIAGAYENKHTPATFGTKNNVSGGALINLLSNNYSSSPAALEVIALIKKHSSEWITQLVEYRDDFTHRVYPRSFQFFRMPLQNTPPVYKTDWLLPAQMPNETPVEVYCAASIVNLYQMTRDILIRLPNCDKALISFPELDL